MRIRLMIFFCSSLSVRFGEIISNNYFYQFYRKVKKYISILELIFLEQMKSASKATIKIS